MAQQFSFVSVIRITGWGFCCCFQYAVHESHDARTKFGDILVEFHPSVPSEPPSGEFAALSRGDASFARIIVLSGVAPWLSSLKAQAHPEDYEIKDVF